MPPRFIADIMLGKLARWMRLLGYDVVYTQFEKDSEIVEEAAEKQRLILTRDTQLVREHPRVSHLIRSTNLWEQLREMLGAFPIDVRRYFLSRCGACNLEVTRVDKALVEDRLPPFVRQTQEEIYRCPRCGKLYWPATHVLHIKQLIKEHLGIQIE